MTRFIAICLMCFASIPSIGNANEIDTIPADNRIKMLTYSAGDVYTINTKYGYQTSIVFAGGEEISTISVGDRSQWQIIPNGNRIFIRPLLEGLSTNMTVLTTAHEYTFDIKSLKSTAKESESNNVYVAQFRYPEANPVPAAEMASSAAPMPSITANSGVSIPPLDTQRTLNLNREYTYTGNDGIAPSEVYDDGKNTFIVYEKLPTDTPQPFIIAPTGQRVLANYKLDGNRMIVVMLVSDILILKNKTSEITIYNESLKVKP